MNARGSSLHDAFAQRFTLNEVLFWLGSAAVVVGALDYLACGLRRDGCVCMLKSAKISAQDLQSIADGWRADNDDECPTPQRLKDEEQMSAASNTKDPWGSPWKISCCAHDTTVISNGPDRIRGTRDDIFFPPDEHWCK